MMLDQLREQANTQAMTFGVARAMGSEIDPPPSYDDMIARLDELLAQPFARADDPQQQLREALGLRG